MNEHCHNGAMEAISYHLQNGEVHSEDDEIQQPRQPSNLQGLLRFAVEATRAEDAPHESHVAPLDGERRNFLESAIRSMTVDVIEVLQQQIQILQNVENVKDNDDIRPFTSALETILENVDNIDIANDFYKIGGFNILRPCFKCLYPEIRIGACDVLAELCQNNPFCQRKVQDEHFIPLLLRLLDSEVDINVCVKVLHAVSCIVRQNADAFQQMMQYEGLSILLKNLQKGDDKLTTKTTFLLLSLCGSQPDLISRLVFMDYVPALLTLLSKERTPCYEHILSLLLCLAEDNEAAISECQELKYDLQQILENNLGIIAHKEEFREEESCCKRLLNLLFK